jgi:hypothetical protein
MLRWVQARLAFKATPPTTYLRGCQRHRTRQARLGEPWQTKTRNAGARPY